MFDFAKEGYVASSECCGDWVDPTRFFVSVFLWWILHLFLFWRYLFLFLGFLLLCLGSCLLLFFVFLSVLPGLFKSLFRHHSWLYLSFLRLLFLLTFLLPALCHLVPFLVLRLLKCLDKRRSQLIMLHFDLLPYHLKHICLKPEEHRILPLPPLHF